MLVAGIAFLLPAVRKVRQAGETAMHADELRAAALRLLAEIGGHAAVVGQLLESRPQALDYAALAQVFGTAEAVCKRLEALRAALPSEGSQEAGEGPADAV